MSFCTFATNFAQWRKLNGGLLVLGGCLHSTTRISFSVLKNHNKIRQQKPCLGFEISFCKCHCAHSRNTECFTKSNNVLRSSCCAVVFHRYLEPVQVDLHVLNSPAPSLIEIHCSLLDTCRVVGPPTNFQSTRNHTLSPLSTL